VTAAMEEKKVEEGKKELLAKRPGAYLAGMVR
jgi:hypothetical protein